MTTTTALTRADVLILLYAGMAVLALCCVYAAAEWLFWRAVDRLPFEDHAECEHPDGCDVALCYCGNPTLCPGTEEPRCSHHWFLCSAHAHVDCPDCADDAQVEDEHAYARDEGWS